ncbi:MAG: helix-turn-helix domain-containing protein [Synergistaceae bacterium]
MSKEIDESKKNDLENDLINKEEESKSKFVVLGSKLRKLREAQNISLAEVADHTKIQEHFIAAIEEGKLEILPKGPYLRGFLRQYCSYLSADDLWDTYDNLTGEQTVQFISLKKRQGQVEYSSKPKIFKQRPLPIIYTVIFLSFLAAAFVTWQLRPAAPISAKIPTEGGNVFAVVSQDKDIELDSLSTDITVPSNEVSVDLEWMDGKPDEQDSAILSADIALTPTNVAVAKNELKIVPSALVWIRVSRADKILFQGLIKQGEDKTFTVTEDAPLRLKSGKPKETGLVWQGKNIDSMGDFIVPVVRYYWIDGAITETETK